MNPTSTRRLRSFTAALFLSWAVLAIVLSLAAFRAPGSRLTHPIDTARLGGTALVSSAAAGPRVEQGDKLIAVNGVPFLWAIREGRQCARAIDQYLMGSSELPLK